MFNANSKYNKFKKFTFKYIILYFIHDKCNLTYIDYSDYLKLLCHYQKNAVKCIIIEYV
jgi:hypothetical protein